MKAVFSEFEEAGNSAPGLPRIIDHGQVPSMVVNPHHRINASGSQTISCVQVWILQIIKKCDTIVLTAFFEKIIFQGDVEMHRIETRTHT